MSNENIAAGYILHDGYPSVEDYVHLRTASGLSPKTTAQATVALQNSWYGCYVTRADEGPAGKAVAMGRVIGDGGWYFHIADMAVLPDHQRRGLGDSVLKCLLAKIKTDAVPGVSYVSLMADGPGRKLYAKNGFVDGMPASMGMTLVFNVQGSEEGA
ncbi:putative gnat family n- protein [Eutypa lata UCREL1]|uniref:Putative gnat family n-protein n=1 Tax=Eutypa lata (strain UCR-EL1) TaxID=1287681 RepID=M7SZ06_EUTLA|nr:putative gnat family n- protein [Eutypa lata UCREL1]